MTEKTQQPSAKERYNHLKTDRSQAETRAKNAADLTVPALYKQYTKGKSHPTYTIPYQGTGAKCVNSLSARMLLALFPPNASFFKMSPDGQEVAALAAQIGIEQGQLEEGLAEIERTIINDIETSGMRGRLSQAMKHAVATGNFCLYVPDEGNAKVYPLTRFVVDRDGMGTMLELVTLDSVATATLDPAILSATGLDKNQGEDSDPNEEVELYTRVYREDQLWQVYQEVNGVVIPGSDGSYPIDASPWIAVRIPEEDGESYGSGIVNDYISDFSALDKLRKALLKGAAAAAKVLWALDPNSIAKPNEITTAESGKVLRFKYTDLKAVTQDKYGDFNFVKAEADTMARSLEMAFGVRTSIQRSGERVTAEEIRYLAQELEDVLGGIYSILAEDLLLPLIRRILARLQSQHRLPDLPKGIVKPRIVVGVAALGRGQDLRKLEEWAEAAQKALGPQVFAQRVDPGELMARLGAAADISMKGLLKTDQQLQQEQQQATMQQAAVRAAPNVASAALSQQPQGAPNG